jgi:secreted PhoX family phosphatase
MYAPHRRDLLKLAGLTALQWTALGCRSAPPVRRGRSASGALSPPRSAGFGPLLSTSGAPLDLPAGFRAVVVQRAGVDMLDDGRPVPGCFDGMDCFDAGDGRWVLLRNHEMGDGAWIEQYGYTGQRKVVTWSAADAPINPTKHGGVSRVEVERAALLAALDRADAPKVVVSTRMSLTGTDCNCSGGRWMDGWITCEETDSPGHGYAYHVPSASGASPSRLETWGRFKREGIARAPDGTVYMSEDHPAAGVYRFRPRSADAPFGEGVLEVLCVPGLGDTRTLPPDHPLTRGEAVEVRWLPVPDPHALQTPCRAQVIEMTRVARTEGMIWDGQRIWLSATEGGRLGKGQLWQLTPNGARVTLRCAVEVTAPAHLSLPDNLALSPWGDVLLCEDNYSSDATVTHQHLRGIDRDGAVYDIARNPQNTPVTPGEAPGDEFTGACFSPDGRVLFVNLQGGRDETIAITGPWPHLT